MEEQLVQRLKELKAEFEAGQKMLADLEARKIELEKTLLRISGAIQVLEEELTKHASQKARTNSAQPEETSELSSLAE
jgi:hypothetical protein